MKTGRSIQELAQLIDAQSKAKVDFIASTEVMSVQPADKGASDKRPRLIVDNVGSYPMRDHALQQVAERVGMPIKYVRRCQDEAPQLLATNLNTWLHQKPENRLVRVLNDENRAFLSNVYQRTDNYDVMNTVLPIFREYPDLVIRSCEVTESRMYLKASLKSLTREIKSARVGDVVEAGLMIGNSEIGLGSTFVTPWANFLICTNGMVRDGAKRWNHVGAKQGTDGEVTYLAEDTKRAMDRASLLQIRDQVRYALDATRFDDWLAKVQVTTTRQVTGNPTKAVEMLSQVLGGLTQSEEGSIMRHLIQGGDLSQYGLVNAVTRTAEDLADYDRATEFEAMGQRVVDLTQGEWKRVSEAA